MNSRPESFLRDVMKRVLPPAMLALLAIALVSARPTEVALEPERNLYVALLATVVLVTIALVLGIRFGIRRITRPLSRMIEDIHRLRTPERLGERLAPTGPKELRALAVAFNSANQKLEREISERKQARNQMLEAIETMGDGFAVFDADDRMVLCNTRYREFYDAVADILVPGTRFEDILRIGAERGLYADAIGREEEWIGERLASHRVLDGPVEQRLGDGRWLQISEHKTKSGETVGIRSDITELKRRENALRESEARIRAILNNTADAIVTIDDDGIIETFNYKAEQIFGYPAAEVVGRDVEILMPEPEASAHDRYVKRYVASGHGPVIDRCREVVGRHRDGGTFPAELALSEVRLGERRIFIGIINDITRRKQAESEKAALEAELRQAQKMESLGTLAGGIAHEFNNMLVPMLGLTELVKDDLPEHSESRENLDNVLEAGLRAKSLIRNILAFSREEKSVASNIVLQSVLAETQDFLRATIPATIQIREVIDKIPAVVRADRTELHQVLINLVGNAVDAIDGTTGSIELGLEHVIVGQSSAAQLHPLSAGRHARIWVRDSGPGIDRAIIDRVFDPFFTTKTVGTGTGMGLAVVHTIVSGLGGRVDVTSAPDLGTTFDIYLPLVDDDEADRPEAPRNQERETV